MTEYLGEERRLHALRQYRILDTEPEEAFDRITRIVAAALRVPMASVTLVDDHRQWFKARIGLLESETSRDNSFCAHTMVAAGPMVVEDARQDARFRNNPFVTGDPNIRFYAGYPIVSEEGLPIGAVCAIDTTPRSATDQEIGLLKDLAALVAEQLELRLAASRDGLTGAMRRTAFLDLASQALALDEKAQLPSSCLMVDADYFKAINDVHGHEVGDEVLQRMVHTLKAGLRSTDLIGRLGGEEFGIFLPATDLEGAAEVAERIRAMVAALEIDAGLRRVPVTISIGVAEANTAADDIHMVLHNADLALMSAKQTGRNRIVCADEPLLTDGGQTPVFSALG